MLLDSIWIFLVPIVVIAGVVRGYAGFGFAAVAVVCMNFLLDPQQSIPVIVALDLLCSAPLSSPLSSSAQRATMIMFFVISELVALAALAAGGLINVEVVKMTVILLIPTLIGVRIGQALFNRKPPASLKQFALPLMFMIAVLGISATAGS